MTVKIKRIHMIMLFAFIIRIGALFLIILLGKFIPPYGFTGDVWTFDDLRFEKGAIIYSETASSLIDEEAFLRAYASLRDWVGYNSRVSWFSATPLWYWILCIVMYVTHSRWILRIMNIVFATLCVGVLYKLGCTVYSKKTALLAARLLAYLPYPVVFSCFLYKDTLVMLCTLYIVYFFARLRKNKDIYYKLFHAPIRIKLHEIVTLLLAITAFVFIRSGLSVILIMLAVFYAFQDIIKFNGKLRTIVFYALGIVVAAVAFLKFGNIILYKFQFYNGEDAVSSDIGIGRILKIQSITQIWKLPMTYLIAVAQPIHIGAPFTSWSNVINNVNVVMFPISVGSAMYIFQRKKDKVFFWLFFWYYMIYAISSVLIFRQLYSPLVFPILFFAEFYTKSKSNSKYLMFGASAAIALALCALFLL